MPAAASMSRGGLGCKPWWINISSGVVCGSEGGKQRLAARNSRTGGAGEMEHVIEREEQAEHFGAADDGERAGADLERPIACSIVAPAGFHNNAFGCDGSATTSATCRVTIRRLRPAARGPPSCEWRPCTIAAARSIPVCRKSLIGLVANGIRHRSVAVGDHAVGGYDGVAFDGVRSDHGRTIAGSARGESFVEMVPVHFARSEVACRVCIIVAERLLEFKRGFEKGPAMTRPSEITRDRILKAAERLFAERGYDGHQRARHRRQGAGEPGGHQLPFRRQGGTVPGSAARGRFAR